MEEFFNFFSFQDPTVRSIVFGSILLSFSSSMVGCFTFLRKRSLVGDAVAHAVLPGVCVAFAVQGTKDPLILLIGAFISGWLSLVVIDFITLKSRIKEDTAIGLVLSIFFAVGSLLLTTIQHTSLSSEQSGLDHFLFGNAAAISEKDIYTFGGVAIIMILAVLVFYKSFKILSFDEEFAASMGLPVRGLQLLLTTLTVFAVVIGIQTVGVVLMAAMLITPAAAARFWTDKLGVMIMLASLIGVLSSVFGAYTSYATTSPTGPWIVVLLSVIAILSFIFSPRKGIITRLFRQYRFKRKILEENILKTFYQLGETSESLYTAYSTKDLLTKRPMHPAELTKGMLRLRSHGFIERDTKNTYKLTTAGLAKGERITRIHRLWELYLTKYLNIAPDHVHEDAESIEHIITPEMEMKLTALLGNPTEDPHNTAIPYREDRLKNQR